MNHIQSVIRHHPPWAAWSNPAPITKDLPRFYSASRLPTLCSHTQGNRSRFLKIIISEQSK